MGILTESSSYDPTQDGVVRVDHSIPPEVLYLRIVKTMGLHVSLPQARRVLEILQPDVNIHQLPS